MGQEEEMEEESFFTAATTVTADKSQSLATRCGMLKFGQRWICFSRRYTRYSLNPVQWLISTSKGLENGYATWLP